jgi:hypothetical protein
MYKFVYLEYVCASGEGGDCISVDGFNGSTSASCLGWVLEEMVINGKRVLVLTQETVYIACSAKVVVWLVDREKKSKSLLSKVTNIFLIL